MEDSPVEVEKKEGKDDKLLKILKDGGKPYVKKCDGNAVKIGEDKEITYKDYEGQENVLKIPAGSYIVAEGNSNCPKIITAEEFEKKNKFIEGSKKKENPKKEDKPSIGMSSMDNY